MWLNDPEHDSLRGRQHAINRVRKIEHKALGEPFAGVRSGIFRNSTSGSSREKLLVHLPEPRVAGWKLAGIGLRGSSCLAGALPSQDGGGAPVIFRNMPELVNHGFQIGSWTTIDVASNLITLRSCFLINQVGAVPIIGDP